MPPHEPTVVLTTSKPPPGYRLVPKGQPYITLNCRKQTHAQGRKVYKVLDKPGGQVMGIRVPREVYDSVLASFHETKSDRADAVKKRDGRAEDAYRDAVVAAFPKVPRSEIGVIVRRAMRKRSGRVGRTGKLSVERKAVLGVLAHIRHMHSSYDELLKGEGRSSGGGSVDREEARRRTAAEIERKAAEWGYTWRRGGKGGERNVDDERNKDRTSSRKDRSRSAKRKRRSGHGRDDSGTNTQRRRNDSASNNNKNNSDSPASSSTIRARNRRNRQRPGPTPASVGTSSPPKVIQRGFTMTRAMARALGNDSRARPDTAMSSLSLDSDSFDDDDAEDSTAGEDGGTGDDDDDVIWISSDDDFDDGDDSYEEDDYDD